MLKAKLLGIKVVINSNKQENYGTNEKEKRSFIKG
jgi:hypothetical protein